MKKIKRYFTLAELLVAMAVFSILSLILLNIVNTSLKVFNSTNADILIYENARVALDVITKDLQNAIASDDIRFIDRTNGDDILYFTTSSEDTDLSNKSSLVEIGYKLDSTTNEFKRSETNDSSGNWDFYNKTNYDGTADTYFSVVKGIKGVNALSFTCYESDLTAIATESTRVPAVVLVKITVVDANLIKHGMPSAVINNSARTFRKVIYLDSL